MTKPGCPHDQFPRNTRQVSKSPRIRSVTRMAGYGVRVTEDEIIGWRVTRQDYCSRCGADLGPRYVVEEGA